MTNFYSDLGLNLNLEGRKLYIDSPSNLLIERAVALGQGKLTKDGSLVVKTGKHTGRSAGDKYVVKSESTKNTIWWENSLNEMSAENFAKLKSKALDYLNERDLYITERSVGAHEKHNIFVRTISERPSHALFTQHLFREKMASKSPSEFLILHVPEMKLDPKEFGAKSETIVATCFDTKVTIITGTLYAGEVKKSMFCVLNYALPESKVLPMHAGAAQRTQDESVSVFFGLSGTGKTTLSTDEGTLLIGDDEHGLSDEGVFNFEGGCYAKTYKLSAETEPGIWRASNRFGALLENVVLDENTGEVNYNDKSLSENGRSSYPLSFIKELEPSSKGKVPEHIFFLSADAFGVLPPISKLTKSQAMFYFVLGYTAKLAGTEIGVVEPQAAFSPCFGAPFMLRHPSEYAELLGDYLDKHNINVWLINTGWSGGVYGVGSRFPLPITRKIIRTVQAGKLSDVATEEDPIFGLHIPCQVGDIPSHILKPQESWSSASEYISKAQELARAFHQQMAKFGSFAETNSAGAPLFK